MVLIAAGVAYGALGAVAILMLWLLLIALVVILLVGQEPDQTTPIAR